MWELKGWPQFIPFILLVALIDPLTILYLWFAGYLVTVELISCHILWIFQVSFLICSCIYLCLLLSFSSFFASTTFWPFLLFDCSTSSIARHWLHCCCMKVFTFFSLLKFAKGMRKSLAFGIIGQAIDIFKILSCFWKRRYHAMRECASLWAVIKNEGLCWFLSLIFFFLFQFMRNFWLSWVGLD